MFLHDIKKTSYNMIHFKNYKFLEMQSFQRKKYWGDGKEVAQTMYAHMSKYKSDKKTK
jgi:hypothetical protein